MKYLIPFAFLFVLLVAPAAQAAEAYAVANVNLRAGPDGGYPVVDTLGRGERVELLGCINGLQWCEVETRHEERGWIYAHYLNTSYNGRAYTIIQSNGLGGLRIITFTPRNYWDKYYRTKYFYRDRDRWLPPDHHHHDHDDDDDHHGHAPKPRPQPEPEPEKPLKYHPMEAPDRGKGKYNPLCPMGEVNC